MTQRKAVHAPVTGQCGETNMQKRIFLVLWLCLLTCASNSFAAAGLLAPGTASPTPFPGNTVVNVSPGSGTISAAVKAHGGNTTYLLANGIYNETGVICTANYMQFIGSGAANVLINSTNGAMTFNNWGLGNPNTQYTQIWGMTIDLQNQPGMAIGGTYSNLLFQNVHVRNFCMNQANVEEFPIYLYGENGYGPSNQTIDHCQFTASASGNLGGISVIQVGCQRNSASGPANYSNITISNNLFDTPTDGGIQYFHCMGSSFNTCSGKVYVAANIAGGSQFVYGEPHDINGDNTCTITGNTVTLAPNMNFVGVAMSPNGTEPSKVITGNTIHGNSSDGAMFALFSENGCSTVQANSINSVTIQNNAIDAGITVASVREFPNYLAPFFPRYLASAILE